MKQIINRLSALRQLLPSLSLTFAGIVLLSLGVAYLFIHAYRTVEGLPEVVWWLTLQFLPRPLRGFLLLSVGLLVLAGGIWQLSGVVVIPRPSQLPVDGELVLGYDRAKRPRRIAVISGGAGMLVLSSLSDQVDRMTCIVPVTDPVEYYYRASGLLNQPNVYYVVPTPIPLEVVAELDDGTLIDVRHIHLHPELAQRRVQHLRLTQADPPPLTRVAIESLHEADAIVLGPGSLFESILPNFLLAEFAEAVRMSAAKKIFVCNLMTEPGRTTGFRVADHIRAIKEYAGFTPDYVLVNAQRIDPETTRIYAAANQTPVYLDPGDYEELAALPGDTRGQRGVIIEGSLVIETDLAAAVIQYMTSLDNPQQSRAVRVLRHDGQKLAAALLELLRRM
ncbi:2-phospho-L-lactate transferase CofD family protein [uncultured Chloroflexus sp.]|uniref:gluconeogenesis factor YvcK family protein n=1 Tax=uncultured Chloroflexus sp. TaxID=214040 RepID=UPI0026191175|nr:2-phospho-L-lactate transferase CofD family protein [uncultured Chloroflexus sp.]